MIGGEAPHAAVAHSLPGAGEETTTPAAPRWHRAARPRFLGLPILLVPLFAGPDYGDRVDLGLRTLLRRVERAHRLVFGDLHLEHVRQWREEAMGPWAERLGLRLHYPLWQVSYDTLAAELAAAPVTCRLSAVDSDRVGEAIQVGDVYGPELVARLPEGVDAFGENGEFHSYVEIS